MTGVRFPARPFFSLPTPRPDTPRPLGKCEHATHAAPRARKVDLDLYVVLPGVRIIREETPALRRPSLLPLSGPGVTASRADDKALGMERMRHRLGLPVAYGGKSAPQTRRATMGEGRGRGRRRKRGRRIVALGPAHVPQVVAPQPKFVLLGLNEPMWPSGQTLFFRCGRLLLLPLFAWDMAGSCFLVMVFTREPDGLELVCDGGGGHGRLSWVV